MEKLKIGEKKKVKNMNKDIKNITNYLFEMGILSQTPRSGFFFLGSGSQSVAEHINRTCYIGYALALMDGTVDANKVLQMCLFHDVAESRVSDLNYVHQKYTKRDEEKAQEDLCESLPFGETIAGIVKEYETRESVESQMAKDADNLEWIISLKEQLDTGNIRAREWIPSAIKRLKSEPAQKIAEMIMETDSEEWWFADKDDDWWVSRNK